MRIKILVVGTVSNVGPVIRSELKRVMAALEELASLEVFLVESDSTDDSIDKLTSLQKKDSRISFLCLGDLKPAIPSRIERIRYCRNHYVSFVRNKYEKRRWDFVLVVDLDGMNKKISRTSFESTFNAKIQWDACFANQRNGYYDLYALRCDDWVSEDVFSSLEILKNSCPYQQKGNNIFREWFNQFQHFDGLREKAIYSKMRTLPPDGPWIRVHSAFGGLGIYKTEIFLTSNYDFQNLSPEIYSEHLDLHFACTQKYSELYINPAMINNNWNVYNLNKFKAVRFLREFKKFITSLIQS